jgi:hypothetical protein
MGKSNLTATVHSKSLVYASKKCQLKRSTKDNKQKRRHKPRERYNIYIGKVWKSVAPKMPNDLKMKVSANAFATMNDLVAHLFDRIMNESARLHRISRKPSNTVTLKDINTAMLLSMNSPLRLELTKFANKAVTNSLKSVGEDKE